MKNAFLLLFLPFQLLAQFSKTDIARCEQQAKQVTIVRDNWGIPHIYGKTDANAVFGLIYAQCEDDFKRVEMNYIEKLGRLAELNGEKDLYNDLLVRLVIDSADAIKDYQTSKPWMHKLLDAFADGVNYYLYKHPETKPALLHHFAPWYALLWTDGSIGAISTAGLTEKDLKDLYGSGMVSAKQESENKQPNLLASSKSVLNKDDETFYGDEKLTGSNGFAFSPSITAGHHSILYINPHVTHYFRPEVQMVSEEGLNAYGAVTWGQFFVYQGFNEHCGWMHTSSQVDVSDSYIEKISQQHNKWTYEFEHQQKTVLIKNIVIRYQQNGSLQTKNIQTLFTGHGPIMAKKDGQFLSVKSFNRSIISLEQSWLRTKANSFAEFKKILDLKANTSNNTVYADAEGNIAYWHGNYVPIRDKNYDWSKPVDGTIAATDWKGLHNVDDLVHIINPKNGWLQNCNSTPYTVAGNESPKRENYPVYMAPDGENFRGVNAVKVLAREKNYDIDKVIHAGYDTYLAFFENLVPALVTAYNSLSQADSLRAILQQPIEILKAWDLHSGENSVATSLAIEWVQLLSPKINQLKDGDIVAKTASFIQHAAAKDLLQPLAIAVNNLTERYGKWDIAWGEINRFQRLTDDINGNYDDDQPSIPVGFVSSLWGQLPSFNSRIYPNAKKRYGYNGNSFICAVEFGSTIKAKSLLAGGESGDVNSPHFKDQALMYSKGQFKDVLFYKADVLKHAEKTYHPGNIVIKSMGQ